MDKTSPTRDLIAGYIGLANVLEDEIERLQSENERLRANTMIQEKIIERESNPLDKDKIITLTMENATLKADNTLLQAKLDKAVVLLSNHEHVTQAQGNYDAYAIHSLCYAGFDGACKMPHCSGCPIRKMYQIMYKAEKALEEMEVSE